MKNMENFVSKYTDINEPGIYEMATIYFCVEDDNYLNLIKNYVILR